MAQNFSEKINQKRVQKKGSRTKLLNWARSNSLWYYHVGSGCCADEVLSAMGCRYDIERLGCFPQSDPQKADLLFVSTLISNKLELEVKRIYNQMLDPKYVIAVGACVSSGGPFSITGGSCRLDQIIPVDVYVPGCSPRPEAIMYGLLKLREIINGVERSC